jgi:hypothetical protein
MCIYSTAGYPELFLFVLYFCRGRCERGVFSKFSFILISFRSTFHSPTLCLLQQQRNWQTAWLLLHLEASMLLRKAMKLNTIFDQQFQLNTSRGWFQFHCLYRLRKTPYCPKLKEFELQIGSLSRGHYSAFSRRYNPVPLISTLLSWLFSGALLRQEHIPQVLVVILTLELNDVIILAVLHVREMRWRIWLRHCTTSWKDADSIPDDVIEIFHWHNPSGRTVALGLTQSLTEMSTRNISY